MAISITLTAIIATITVRLRSSQDEHPNGRPVLVDLLLKSRFFGRVGCQVNACGCARGAGDPRRRAGRAV
jgi:hypothetical protein